MEINEREIPVPWGIIAAKCWGNEKDPIVVALHGFQDNAGSFDRLIPLLSENFYYVCIDLPSHGKSSHLPTKTYITYMDFLTSLKLVLDYLDRKKYILMGHSYGAQTALTLSQIFPEIVTKLILLDALTYVPIPMKHIYTEFRGLMQIYKKQLSHKASDSPTYTIPEAVQKMLDSRFAKITKESAEILLRRSLIAVGDGRYKISTAQHLKRALRLPFSAQNQVLAFKYFPLHCPTLVLMADQSRIFRSYKKYMGNLVKTKNKFIFRVVQGDHDVHLDHPERVAPNINRFLIKEFQNKL